MVEPGLRERKKLQTRADIVEVASRLFAEHGFENVTLPQVAEAVGVSTKTVFNYFRLKEDIAFASEGEICAAWVHCIRRRANGQTPLDAVRSLVGESLSEPGAIDELLAFQAIVDSSRVLSGRQRMVWDRLEVAVGQALGLEDPSASAPLVRYAASQLVSVLRVLSSPELRDHLEAVAPEERPKAVGVWIDGVLDLVGEGLGARWTKKVPSM